MKPPKPIPPRLADRFLCWFCKGSLQEEILGDLHEYYREIGDRSQWKKDFLYWFHTLHFLRPFAIKKTHKVHLNHSAMLQHNFKIAWRNVSRQKVYSFINIGGFSLGIAACFLIALYVHHELSYDRHYIDGDRIYRVVRESAFDGRVNKGVHFPAPFAAAMAEEYPELERVGHYNAGRNFGAGSNEVRRADRLESTHETGIIFMSQGLLEVLEFSFLRGSREHALTKPNSVVITSQKAEKYFPGEDPIGKVLVLNNDPERQYEITGVIENLPGNSHLPYEIMITLAGKEFWPGESTNWRASNYVNYVRVRPGTDIAGLEAKLSGMLKKYFLPAAIDNGGNKEELDWINSLRFKLQPVQDIYLNTDQIHDQLKHGNVQFIRLFAAISIFILLIAGVNFINLSTARSANRAKEVGLRKVVGSHRGALIRQFLTESILLCFFAFVLGLLLAWLLLPYFNTLVARSLVFPWTAWWLLPVTFGSALVIGTLTGVYPSFYLSSFMPVKVLKGKVSQGSKNASVRSLLVVFQFTISVVLIIGTIILNRQMDYLLNKELGFDKEQVLLLHGTHTLEDRIVTFKNELLQLSAVKYVSISDYLPVDGSRINWGNVWMEGMTEEQYISGQHWQVDRDYVKTMGLKILQGRDFSKHMGLDSQSIIINESMVDALHLDEPIGAQIFHWLGGKTVIGVVEDFHYRSIKEKIRPLCLFLGTRRSTISVKSNTTDMAALIESVTGLWNKFSPHQTIRFSFLDQRYAQMYGDVERTRLTFNGFAGLAIIVACLGLFGLSAFMAEQRRKELSIRKVLGAPLTSLFALLTVNFLKLVLISVAIAAPAGWYLMRSWLDDFAYRIAFGWEIFVIAGLVAVTVALVTISTESLKATLMNPVKNLRPE